MLVALAPSFWIDPATARTRKPAGRSVFCPLSVAVLTGLAVLFSGGRLKAQERPATETSQNEDSDRSLEDAYAFGDWNGEREKLMAEGINLGFHYISESAWAGAYGADYTQQVDIGADLNLAKLWHWQGSQFHFHMGDRKGHDLGQDSIHSIAQTQELWGGGMDVRLYEMDYQYTSPAKHFDTKIGWMPMGNEFGHSTIMCQFESLAFCGHPMTMAYGSGWFNNPKASWGFRLKWSTPLVYGMIGTYNTDPSYKVEGNGFKLNLQGTTGVVVPAEIGFTPGNDSGVLPGHYLVGAYLDTSEAKNVYYDINGNPMVMTGLKAREEPHRSGYYVVTDQTIWQDSRDRNRGLAVFATVSQGDISTSTYRHAYLFGFMLKSPFLSRPDDNIVLGAARLTLNPRVIAAEEYADSIDPGAKAIQSYEQITELAYTWQVTRWFTLRPGVQYMQRPGAITDRNSVWVGEITVKANF